MARNASLSRVRPSSELRSWVSTLVTMDLTASGA
jgi:hypothetical protein